MPQFAAKLGEFDYSHNKYKEKDVESFTYGYILLLVILKGLLSYSKQWCQYEAWSSHQVILWGKGYLSPEVKTFS